MRKFLLSLACLMLLMITPALAQTYSFDDIHAALTLEDSQYDAVLTPYNLSAHSQWIADQGMDYDALVNAFENEGILLKAFDAESGRTLVLTALKDLDAQTYFDLNNQDEDMRKEYRVSHTDGTAYGVLGYSYSTAKWKNYGGTTLRFLQTKYSLRQDGTQVCTGYQRRTIRNGYTITLDLQVTGRAAKDADDTALESIMKSFSFSQVLPMPELPIKLTLTSAPPTETNESVFTIKGSTVKKATVTATVFSLGATGSQTYTDTAASSGAFSMKVTLPKAGVYSVTLTAHAEEGIDAQRMYSVTYQADLLPVILISTPGTTLGDTTIVSGTTIAGAKTQVSITGPVDLTKSTTSKDFNFKLDTSAEGTYTILLTVTKKGLESRTFSYSAVREYSDVERVEKIRSAAKKISYANLSKTANEGKYVYYTGYVTDVTTSVPGEWVLTFALSKSGDTYKDIVYVICNQEPPYTAGSKCVLYGKASGTYSVLGESGSIKNYPRVEAAFFEAAE